jgi:hypothetical protein
MMRATSRRHGGRSSSPFDNISGQRIESWSKNLSPSVSQEEKRMCPCDQRRI